MADNDTNDQGTQSSGVPDLPPTLPNNGNPVAIPAPMPTPPNPKPASDSNDGSDAIDWQRKYSGLQGAFNREKKRGDEMVLRYEQLSTETEQTINALSAEKEALQTTLEALQTEAEKAKAEAAKLTNRFETSRMVHAEFPELAALYDEGLLMGVESLQGDELTNFLTSYRDKLKAINELGVRKQAAGGTPPPPPGQKQTASMSLAEAQAQVQEATAKYGIRSPEYRAAMANLTEVLSRPQEK